MPSTEIASAPARGWLPLRAYADAASPLSLALAGGFATDVQKLTRESWTPAMVNTYEGMNDAVAKTESEVEVISAVIKLTRLTILPSNDLLGDKKRKRKDESPSTRNKKQKVIDIEDSENEEAKEAVVQVTPYHAIAVESAPSVPSIFGAALEDGEAEEDVEEDMEIDTPPHQAASAAETKSSTPVKESDSESDNEDDDGEEDALHTFGTMAMSCPSLKAWNRRHFLWSRFSQGIQMDQTAWYEMIPEAYAKRVATRLRRAIELNVAGGGKIEFDNSVPVKTELRPILAACCGVGGDAVALARFTPAKVVCVDIIPEKIKLAKHNSAVYNVDERMEFICQDINKFAQAELTKVKVETVSRSVEMPIKHEGVVKRVMKETIEEPIVQRPYEWCLMSPPWGGPAYRSQYAYSMGVQEFTDLIAMIQSVMKISDNICLLLPRNQDINELIHLSSKGMPEDRFPYLEIEKLSEKKDGYPGMIAAYLCRTPSLFLADHDPSRSVATLKATERMQKLDKKKAPKLVDPRPALPSWDIAGRVIGEKKAKLGKGSHLSVSDLHNLVYSRFILVYLEEPPHQIVTTELALQLLGISNFLWLVEETLRVVRAGGMTKRGAGEEGARSNGGVFFDILRQCFPAAHNALRKWRKAGIRAWKNNKKITS
eukprot:Blabericola_migrator_1__3154@NODE_1920_length_3560_cov_242_651303_g1227_i0_p1_GENE_NODE_1920_length_3560_cov_242_651303_g1227_i0NODE_1920_length_3560_cov_242_651303_g1227_i0_p1_ORF_typecomplete_len672_score151_48Methyltransf_15/PF09445_10/1_2e34Methyltransf_31/PF13847_6/4_6e10MTS/PF05175_14/4_1e08Met_10/PF02475_16/1_5e07RNA_GG_bind/PF10258_9/4e07Methyltransf_25/PF13649_6/1_6e06Methyltransf_25/PF13649_6/5_2e03tRNA_U5meth_tr/PF05958_11/1_3e05Methyltransf_11/PF08241_12/0_00029Methyltransf_11/PF0824